MTFSLSPSSIHEVIVKASHLQQRTNMLSLCSSQTHRAVVTLGHDTMDVCHLKDAGHYSKLDWSLSRLWKMNFVDVVKSRAAECETLQASKVRLVRVCLSWPWSKAIGLKICLTYSTRCFKWMEMRHIAYGWVGLISTVWVCCVCAATTWSY